MRLAFVLSLSMILALPFAARADVRVQVANGQLVPSAPLAFETHRGMLRPQMAPTLDAIAAYLLAHPTMTIEIGVHTDARGAETFNLRVTQQVADQVRSELVARGVSPARLTSVGYGESRPIADDMTAAGRAANQRVELVIQHT